MFGRFEDVDDGAVPFLMSSKEHKNLCFLLTDNSDMHHDGGWYVYLLIHISAPTYSCLLSSAYYTSILINVLA